MKLFKDLAKGQFLGHPVHVMLIHFPAALFVFAVLLEVIAYITSVNSFAFAAFLCGSFGAAIGWIAACFGIIDLLKFETNDPLFKTGLIHGGLNVTWLCLFTFFCGLEVKDYPSIPLPSLSKVIILVITSVGIMVSNHLGGNLYREKIKRN